MRTIGNIDIIGSSHISKQSISEIKAYIENNSPDIIALELDKGRLAALLSKKQEKFRLYSIFKVGLKGFLLAIIGHWAEKKMGEIVGVKPGSEMKAAVLLARKKKIQIALIDQDITVTLNRFSKAFGWKERWNLLKDIIFAGKRKIPFDIRKVPSDKVIKELLKEVKQKYPSVYRVLVEERNFVMGRSLKKLMEMEPDKRILAIVGAGHVEGIVPLLTQGASFSFHVHV